MARSRALGRAAFWICRQGEGQRKPENEDTLGIGARSLSFCCSSFFLCYQCKVMWLILCVKARICVDGAKETLNII